MVNIFLSLVPFFFWDFTTPKPMWKIALVICNGFIQGFLYASRNSTRMMLEKEIKLMQREIDRYK